MSEYLEHPELPPAQHEEADVTPRQLLMLLAAFAAMLVLATGLVWWIYPSSLDDTAGRVSAPDFPLPRLQPDPRNDMSAFYEAEMRVLHGTGWVDRARGIVHVPIEQAMATVARRGIPDWPTVAPAPGTDGAAPTLSARPLAEVAATPGAPNRVAPDPLGGAGEGTGTGAGLGTPLPAGTPATAPAGISPPAGAALPAPPGIATTPALPAGAVAQGTPGATPGTAEGARRREPGAATAGTITR